MMMMRHSESQRESFSRVAIGSLLETWEMKVTLRKTDVVPSALLIFFSVHGSQTAEKTDFSGMREAMLPMQKLQNMEKMATEEKYYELNSKVELSQNQLRQPFV